MCDISAGDAQGLDVIFVGAVFAALAIVAFVLRIWAHRIQKMPLGWSDYTCGIGLVRSFSRPRLLTTLINVILALCARTAGVYCKQYAARSASTST